MRKNKRILLLSLLLVVASAIGAAAQSTDRDNPTPLTSGEIQGAGGAEKISYYYTFAGGPGQVSATLEAKTKKGAKSASVAIELFDANARSLTSTLLNEGLGGGKEKLDQLLGNGLGRLTTGLGTLTGDTKQQQASSVKLKEKQTLTLRVTVGQGIETYSVKLAGAVEFGQLATSPDATSAVTATAQSPATETTSATETTPATESTILSTEQPTPPVEQPLPTEPAPAAEQPPVAKSKAAIVKIPGKSTQSGQKPAIVKIPGRKPPQ